MKTYKITPQGLDEIKRQMLKKGLPILVVAAIVGISISALNANNSDSDVNVLPFVIPILALFLGFSIYRTVKKQAEIFQSYELTIDEFAISRAQMNLPTAEIPTVKIDSIKRVSTGSLIVSGNGFQILVPKQLQDFAEIESKLASFNPITEFSNSRFKKLIPILPFAFIALMLVTTIIENAIISLILGTLLLAGLGYSAISVLRNKNVDARAKRAMWFVPIVMLAIVMNIVLKFFDGV
ncbi:hypothetical protein [Flavobacterium sp.]|uniref:hypothetical protein n=1 Tax=Flavobacterium sp. TaxID=239 RepID=UPI001221143A|nr:hypothetical protein [Flavobacterium sp.]RZJ72045.1 MAG: hypothetical protein EOO49_08440 [Flavobacterium sp.]